MDETGILFKKYGKSTKIRYYRKNWNLLRSLKIRHAQWHDSELDKAENHHSGYIGTKNGVECYLVKI